MPSLSSERLAESEALHAQVQRFAAEERRAPDAFEDLALRIARYQAQFSGGYRRLIQLSGGSLDSYESLVAVPVDAFRFGRVSVFEPEADVVRLRTSGTTSGARGLHPLRRTDTYRTLSLRFAREHLLVPPHTRCTVVALLEPFEPARESSLAFMTQCFIEDFDGRSLGDESQSSDVNQVGRWLLREGRVDVAGLSQAAALARRRGEPLLLVTTAFALVHLFDQLDGRAIEFPPDSVVMPTGGFKGRSRELDASTLLEGAERTFGVPSARVVGEYGMTELSSQLYQPKFGRVDAGDVYVPPPWLRVDAVDPLNHRVLPAGQVGLARFVDLANVDSAVCIVTQDEIVEEQGGIRLLGRAAGAPLRGCSLASEESLSAGAPP